MKGVVSKVPSSRHCLITFRAVICGSDRKSTSSGPWLGSYTLLVKVASIFTWMRQWSDTWSMGSATMALVIQMFLAHIWSSWLPSLWVTDPL